MKKRNLRKLAVLGLSTGLFLANQVNAKQNQEDMQQSLLLAQSKCSGPNGCGGLTAMRDTPSAHDDINPNDGNLGYHLMTEDELLLELDPQGIALYESLNEEGKALARYVASQRCNGTNKCAGLNACQTDKNDCAGKGSCKGTGKCAFSDKNLAVKVVANKMAKKRQQAINPRH